MRVNISLASEQYVTKSNVKLSEFRCQSSIKAGRSAKTNIQQLCTDIGCSLEDLPEAMDDRDMVAGEGQGNPCS